MLSRSSLQHSKFGGQEGGRRGEQPLLTAQKHRIDWTGSRAGLSAARCGCGMCTSRDEHVQYMQHDSAAVMATRKPPPSAISCAVQRFLRCAALSLLAPELASGTGNALPLHPQAELGILGPVLHG